MLCGAMLGAEVGTRRWTIIAGLACQPGDRLIDLSGKIPRGLQCMDFVISVEQFYARFYIYQLGYPR